MEITITQGDTTILITGHRDDVITALTTIVPPTTQTRSVTKPTTDDEDATYNKGHPDPAGRHLYRALRTPTGIMIHRDGCTHPFYPNDIVDQGYAYTSRVFADYLIGIGRTETIEMADCC